MGYYKDEKTLIDMEQQKKNLSQSVAMKLGLIFMKDKSEEVKKPKKGNRDTTTKCRTIYSQR